MTAPATKLKVAPVACAMLIGATAVMPAHAGKDDNTLTVAFTRPLESLDAYSATAREMIILSRHVWDGLVYRDPETGEYTGNLATSFEWVDETTLDFELREGVTFHNGEPFDADDVVYTLNWISVPENGVRTQRNVNWIDRAEKTGPYSVRVYLKRPFPAAFEYLSGPVVIYPNEYFEEVGPSGMSANPIGTGPYKFAEIEPGKRYVLEINEDYHDGPKGQPSIGTIDWRTIPEQNTQFAELLSGGVDWIWQVPPEQAESLSRRFTVSNEQTMRVGFLSMDAAGRSGDDTPFADVRVRQAIAHAINREAIVEALLKGSSQVLHSACFPSQFGCTDDVPRYEYDPEKAKSLLAEAGYPDGFTTTFHAYRDREYAEAMIGDLKAVGIDVDFNYLQFAALREIAQNGQAPLQFLAWGSFSVNDVSAILSVFFTGNDDDYARDEAVAELLREADTSIDTELRESNYAQVLNTVAEQAYWLPLWSYNASYVYTPELNFTPHSDEVTRFYKASWN